MPTHTDTLVIGGGPAGIAAALALHDQALLLERHNTVGGMSGTLSFAGAVVDLGGHSFHTPHPHVRDLVFGALEMFEQERDARCFHEGMFIPFPFQQHFEHLANAETVADCRTGMDRSKTVQRPADFQDFIDQSYGPGISRHFLTPYNQKLWGRDLRRMDATWTQERVPPVRPSAATLRQGTDGHRRPLSAKSSVAYPAEGGFGEILLALGRKVKNVRTQVTVEAIDPFKKLAYASDGTAFGYRNLISTMPLPQLLARTQGAPAELHAKLATLEATSLWLVIVVVNRPVDTPMQRIYSAEPHVTGHKIALNHNSSDALRQRPVHPIIAEISDLQAQGKTVKEMEAQTIQNFIEMGLLPDADAIVKVKTLHFSHAYPVPTHARDGIVRETKEWLRAHDIHSVGRFGEWAYINSDEAIHRGLMVAAEMASH